ncbi:hypothetical protein ACFX12_023828 [Malus domestica]
MDTISIPLIKAYASGLAAMLGANVMFRLFVSSTFKQNSLYKVSTPLASVTEALKSWRRVKPPALTENSALERSKLGP